MLKKLGLLIFSVFMVFLFQGNVYASSATCEYVYNTTVVSVYYKYNTKISYKVTYKNNNQRYAMDETGAINIQNKDIVDEVGNISCPTVAVNVNSHGNKRFKISFTVDENGDLDGELKDLIEDDLENNSPDPKAIVCVYNKDQENEYSLYWNNGIQVKMTGTQFTNYCDPSIQGDFTEEMFKEGNCPKAYDTDVRRYEDGSGCQGRLVIGSEPTFSENQQAKTADAVEDIYSGNVTDLRDSDRFSPAKLCQDGDCDISVGSLCEKEGVISVLRFLGILLFVAKIFVPILIIGMGIYHLIQIIISGKEDEAKKQVHSIIKRVIMGVIIFLLPSLVTWIFKAAGSEESSFDNCVNCILDVGNCELHVDN